MTLAGTDRHGDTATPRRLLTGGNLAAIPDIGPGEAARGQTVRPGWAVILLAVTVAACGPDDGPDPERAAACEQIQHFAEVATDVGITYDYEPAASPAELARRVDAVVVGRLTGRAEALIATTPEGLAAHYVAYALDIDEVLVGLWNAEAARVLVEFNPAYVDASVMRAAASAAVPVVVFGYQRRDVVPGGLLAAVMEGLATGCDDEPPLGWVGDAGAWTELPSLEALADSLRP